MNTFSKEMSVELDNTPLNPDLEIVIPVYNEQKDLPQCIYKLTEYVQTNVPFSTRITIADNASTDETIEIARQLAHEFPQLVRVVHLEAKGRGRALNAVWQYSDAKVACYMDVDLSTNLNGLVPLIAPLISGHSDLAIGSRLQRNSQVTRGVKREFISRCYNIILRILMRVRFSDAQCGFKAIRTDVAARILPLIQDTGWFWDTELLVIAERIGLRINEVPVDWVDDPNSKVDIVSTAVADLKGCWRVAREISSGELPISELRAAIGREPAPIAGVPALLVGQIVRFAIIGVLSTVLQLALYLLFRKTMNSTEATLISLAICSVFNVILNRGFTFQVRSKEKAATHYFKGFIVFIVTAVISVGALDLLHYELPHASKELELLVLITANIVATLIRFIAFRWVFRHENKNNPDALANKDLSIPNKNSSDLLP